MGIDGSGCKWMGVGGSGSGWEWVGVDGSGWEHCLVKSKKEIYILYIGNQCANKKRTGAISVLTLVCYVTVVNMKYFIPYIVR